MGYVTYIDGQIDFGEIPEANINAMKERIEKIDEDIFHADEFLFEQVVSNDEKRNGNWKLTIQAEWKNYFDVIEMKGFPECNNNSLLEILKRIAVFFPEHTKGVIGGNGEEQGDLWELHVEGKNIIEKEAKIEYVEVGRHIPPEESYESFDIIKARLRGAK